MARPLKLKSEQVVDALKRARGLRTIAADLLAINVKTIDAYLSRLPEAMEIVEHWRKARKDLAEFKLDEAIMRGESWAIVFTLKNARDREYNDRVEINASIGELEPYEYGRAAAALAP